MIRVRIEGSGIAGRVLHRELAQAGIACQLRDRAQFPRDKVCGGVLQWDSWKYLSDTFGLRVPARTLHRISHHWRGRKLAEMKLTPPAVFVSRFVLDAALETGSRQPEKESMLTVDATGADPERGEWLGFQARMALPVEELQMHYGRGICLGISPTPEDDAHIALIVKRALFSDPAELRRYIEKELGLSVAGPFKGTSRIHYGYSEQPMAIGDAKMTTFPFLGLGMKHAVESARLLARCLAEDDPPRYARLHRRLFRWQRLAATVAARVYDSPFQGVLRPLVTSPFLFGYLYRWLHVVK